MSFIAGEPVFFFTLAGMALIGLVYMWLALKYEATPLVFSLVRRSDSPILYWATVGFNGFALAIVYYGVVYVAFFVD